MIDKLSKIQSLSPTGNKFIVNQAKTQGALQKFGSEISNLKMQLKETPLFFQLYFVAWAFSAIWRKVAPLDKKIANLATDIESGVENFALKIESFKSKIDGLDENKKMLIKDKIAEFEKNYYDQSQDGAKKSKKQDRSLNKENLKNLQTKEEELLKDIRQLETLLKNILQEQQDPIHQPKDGSEENTPPQPSTEVVKPYKNKNLSEDRIPNNAFLQACIVVGALIVGTIGRYVKNAVQAPTHQIVNSPPQEIINSKQQIVDNSYKSETTAKIDSVLMARKKLQQAVSELAPNRKLEKNTKKDIREEKGKIRGLADELIKCEKEQGLSTALNENQLSGVLYNSDELVNMQKEQGNLLKRINAIEGELNEESNKKGFQFKFTKELLEKKETDYKKLSQAIVEKTSHLSKEAGKIFNAQEEESFKDSKKFKDIPITTKQNQEDKIFKSTVQQKNGNSKELGYSTLRFYNEEQRSEQDQDESVKLDYNKNFLTIPKQQNSNSKGILSTIYNLNKKKISSEITQSGTNKKGQTKVTGSQKGPIQPKNVFEKNLKLSNILNSSFKTEKRAENKLIQSSIFKQNKTSNKGEKQNKKITSQTKTKLDKISENGSSSEDISKKIGKLFSVDGSDASYKEAPFEAWKKSLVGLDENDDWC